MRFNLHNYAASVLALLVMSVGGVSAAELELKSLGGLGEDESARKYGPYVSVSAGETFGQTGSVQTGGRSLSLNDVGGSAIFSIEVGKSWKMKRLPLMTSVSFEGTFMSTSISGRSADAALAGAPGDLVAYEGDMNSLMFTLNASLSLDLWRYRARMGKVLAGFRPYIGAGMGGGQVWFRGPDGSVRNQSRAQFQNTGTTAPTSTVFGIDEFINSWQWYAGVEWTWEDRYSAFVEYRDFSFGDLDDLKSFETDGYLVGFRYRY